MVVMVVVMVDIYICRKGALASGSNALTFIPRSSSGISSN